MLNLFAMTGRITADLELKKTPNGVSVTTFSIANQRNFKNADNERETDFYNVVAWRGTAEHIAKYFMPKSIPIPSFVGVSVLSAYSIPTHINQLIPSYTT